VKADRVSILDFGVRERRNIPFPDFGEFKTCWLTDKYTQTRI
jgi:hypothetical protein